MMTKRKLHRLLDEAQISFTRITNNLRVYLEDGSKVFYKELLRDIHPLIVISGQVKEYYDPNQNETFIEVTVEKPKKKYKKKSKKKI